MDFPLVLNVSSASTVWEKDPVIAVPYVCILTVVAVGGTVGNILVIAAVLVRLLNTPSDHARGYIFMCNLACSDLVVTALINPFAVLGVVYGEDLYAGHFGWCRFLASACVISCVVSLLSIGCIAANRYVYICHNARYPRIFSPRKSVGVCAGVWMVGALLDLPNHVSWSRHAMDTKTAKCFWDRAYNHHYTELIIAVGIICPLVAITVMYGRIFIKVVTSKQKVASHGHTPGGNPTQHSLRSALQQTKMLFVVFLVFAACWAPYACVLLVDERDTYDARLHLAVSLTAHVHASANCVIYGCGDRAMRRMYGRVLGRGGEGGAGCCGRAQGQERPGVRLSVQRQETASG